LNQAHSPFCLYFVFEIRSHELCPGWPPTYNSCASTSWVAGIIGVCHYISLKRKYWFKKQKTLSFVRASTYSKSNMLHWYSGPPIVMDPVKLDVNHKNSHKWTAADIHRMWFSVFISRSYYPTEFTYKTQVQNL
jgi:hypothetical protein